MGCFWLRLLDGPASTVDDVQGGAHLVDARVAGILALEANRLLQPRTWQPLPASAGTDEKGWRPIWALACEEARTEEGGGGASSRRRSSSTRGDEAGPRIGSTSRSHSRSESAAAAHGASSSAAASLCMSARIRAQCLAVMKCLATHHPKALASHWALLVPDGPVRDGCLLVSEGWGVGLYVTAHLWCAYACVFSTATTRGGGPRPALVFSLPGPGAAASPPPRGMGR